MRTRVKVPTSLSGAGSPWLSFARIPGGGVPTPGFHVTASITQVSPAVLSVRSALIVGFPNLSIRLANGVADNDQLSVVRVRSQLFMPGC